MTSLSSILRRRKRLLGPFRLLHYRLWRATRVSGISLLKPELRLLREIARRSRRHVAPPTAPRILFFTFRAWSKHVIADALLAHALRLRGADVRFFTCGGRLPVCDVASHNLGPPMPCDSCAPFITETFKALDFSWHEMRDFISPSERADIERQIDALAPEDYATFELEGLPLGELVRPSVQWFLLTGSPPFDHETKATYRRFLVSGATIARVAGRLLDELKPDKLYLLNGIFFAERIAIEHARRRGIPFITHEGGFMPDSQVFTDGGFAPHHDLSAFWPDYVSRPLTETENRLLDDFLRQRVEGKQDVARYYPSIQSDKAILWDELGLDRERPTVVLFTNVDWDTATFAARSAFANMEDWLQHTIRYFASRPEYQLVIRVHPAEIRLPFLEPRNTVLSMVRRHFPELPPNVRLVPPESSLSSYALMDLSVLGLVYTSTTGMEMTLRGKPVITGGRAYYSGRGFTFDAQSPANFDSLVESALPSSTMTAERIELARRYAFLFFFRHHIPFPLTKTTANRMRFTFDDLDALQPGRDPYLDLICDGVLHGRPFLVEHTF